MAGFVADGLFADISDVWASEGWDSSMASTMPSVTFNGKQYAVPYSYYQWGIYYRKDIYEANGISIPKTYDEFLDNCKKLKAKGIASVAIGTKYLWTAAGWFDYINMRTNGLDYHINLMLGKTKYTDQGVVNTFKNWARAIDAGCFMDDHQNYSWQEAQAPLINGEAASYLIGNFIVANLPEETQGQLDFYQFPPIDPNMDLGEDAPTEIIFMPANAQNVENGKKFMAFFAQPENLTAMNNVLGQLSPHSGSAAPSDRFQRAGAKMLSKSKTAQFFDRDTTPEMAKAAMELGYYLSISGIVTFKNASDLREVVKKIPLERLLVETDSPWLAPVPHRGKQNEPAFVKDVAQFVADLKDVPLQQLAEQTTDNFFNLFSAAQK